MSITLTKETSLFKKDVIKDGISGAAATATDYIDDVPNSSQTGMTLQPVSNNANNYIQLDSDGLAVYKSGNLIASYGQSILLYHPGVSPLNAAVEITNNSARFTGQIQADSGYIGGWSIGADTNQSLHNGAANVSPAPGEGKIILSTGIHSTIRNGLLPANKDWAFTAGNQFGVTTSGELYASAAHLEGLSVGNYSDATTNHLYGNCVWTPPFAAYFNTDLGNTRRTYQGWTIEQNTGEYFDFDSTNNWLVVDYSDYANKATTKVLQQNTGIVAPNTNFTISADLGTDCKVVFGDIEISGTDWQTADDGRKYATFTTTANTTSGVFEIWPVASENYIFKGNKFKLEKSDSYSSWSTLDEQISKTGNAIGQSAEGTSSYFLNFSTTNGLKIAQTNPAQATSNYIQITSNGVKTIYDNTHFSNLTSDGFRIYSGDNTYPVADFITDSNSQAVIHLYKPGTNIAVTTIDSSGGYFTGEITATSGYIGNGTNGFTIDSYGFYSGSKSGTTSGYITLSNTNFTRVINNTSRSLRFAIGSKFGVSADGTLYAHAAVLSGLTIDGYITETEAEEIAETEREKYITDISNYGIKVKSATNNNNYITIDSTGMKVYVSSYSAPIAQYGVTATIGLTSSTHIYITSTGSDAGIKFKTKGSSTTGLVIGDFGFNNNTGYTAEGWPEQAWYTLGYRDGYKGYYSTIAGYGCKATNSGAFAGGIWSKAYGPISFSYGHLCETGKSTQTSVSSDNESYGWASIAMGSSCIAQGNVQIAMGAYNVTDTTSLFILGNGNENVRKNAMTVDWSANTVIAGTLTVQNHGTAIGSTLTTDASNKSIATGTDWTSMSGATLSLTAGSWVVSGAFYCPTCASGKRIGMRLYNSTSGTVLQASRNVIHTSNTAAATVNGASSITTSTTITIQLQVFQSSGSSQTCDGYLRAVRIA